MGDRAMAEIKMDGGSLYVYTHWSGCDLPDNAKSAVLAAKPRWDDEAYAVRIIVDQLTKEARDQETGCGLMLKPNAEDEYNSDSPSVIIDLSSQTITTYGHDDGKSSNFNDL